MLPIKYVYLFLFILLPFSLQAQLNLDSPITQQKVETITQKVEVDNKLVETYDPNSRANLPIGLIKRIGTTRYIIAIDQVAYEPKKALFNAYAAIEFPNTGQKMAFAATNLQFNPNGVGGGANTRLQLVGTTTINISPQIKLQLIADGTSNYVDWDCNGFKSIHLKGFFEIGQGLITPDKSISPNESTVKAFFEISTNDIHDFIAQVSITPFVISGVNDISFSVINATVDMSETQNPQNLVFNQGMDSSAIDNSWTGFYIKDIRVRLPKELNKTGTTREFIASNVLIDHAGFSGSLIAANVLNITEGKLGSWSMSLDNVAITFTKNKLTAGSLSGQINLPIANTTSIKYTATLTQDIFNDELNYNFAIATATTVSIPAFFGKMDIYPNSTISVSRVNGEFIPKALLNGSLSINHNLLNISNINFQNLEIATTSPYLRNGIMSVVSNNTNSSNNNVAGIRLSLDSISLILMNGNPTIGITAGMNLMDNQSSASFSAKTAIYIDAKENTSPNAAVSYTFDKLRIADVMLAINTGPVDFQGVLSFKESDPTYGKGFFGEISITIKEGPNKIFFGPIKSNFGFGTVNAYKYWYADVSIPLQIPLGATGMAIYRAKGALYYHMAPSSNVTSSTIRSNITLAYVPDNTKQLGLKAGITIGIQNGDKLFNADAVFEILFNSPAQGGGIALLKLNGEAFMLTTIAERYNKSPSQLPLYGSVNMTYDINLASLDGLINVQLHTSELNGTGNVTMHFDNSSWFVYFGTPNSRFNVITNIGPQLNAYMDMGSQVPSTPSPPQWIVDAIGNYGTTRDVSALLSKSGLIMGASLHESKSLSITVAGYGVYGNFKADIGFDVMLSNNNSVICSNTGNRLGINGWYASGQAYAGISATVGATVKNRQIEIFDSQIVGLLTAQLPEPYYFSGSLSFNLSVLDVINVDFDFPVSFGKQCIPS